MNHCPVCRARFRGARVCSRCGADLGPLMRLVVHASQLRQAARRALDAGDVARALTLASAAQRVEWTPGGESLRLLTAWLNTPSAAPGLSLSVTAEVTAPLTPEAGEQL